MGDNMTPECRLCIAQELGTQKLTVDPTDDLALCQAHWNWWLNFIFSDEMPPCAAHLIRETEEKP